MNPVQLDPHTWGIYLEVPGSKVVLLQALFELYEGLGTVRTINIKHSLVCVMTTNSLLESCLAALHGLRDEVPWRFAEQIAEITDSCRVGDD